MILSVFLRLFMVFSFTFPKPSQTIDYHHISDADYTFINVDSVKPFLFRPYRFHPWHHLVFGAHVPVNRKSVTENALNKSIAISGRSPQGKKISLLRNNKRHKLNSTLMRANEFNGKQLSNTDSIALADVIVDLIIGLLVSGGVAGVGVGALALLSGFNPKNLFTGVQSNMRGLIQGDFTSCSALSGDFGYCTSIISCNSKNGIASGVCANGGVCCTNSLTSCSGTVQFNNTYWQSSSTVNSDSICVVTIKLDPAVAEQRGPICQLRIDFLTFNIAQPNSESVCANDVFSVGGTDFNVPSICGENEGTHMYLNVPTPISDILLSFKFGGSGLITGKREWRIQIAMLACIDSTLLAPFGCLQYYSLPSGSINSFNWADTTDTATRQLSNQNYDICFRRELVDSSTDTTLCFTPSVTPNNGKAFSLTGANASVDVAGQAGYSQAKPEDCNNDYLIIPNSYDPSQLDSPTNFGDRYCGERLNLLPMRNISSIICTNNKPYRIIYGTNGDETLIDTMDAANIGNLGFSLRYYHIKS